MRSDPAQFDLTAPATLSAALQLLALNTHVPIAGGTELMVALAAGRLPLRPLLSLHLLKELRFIDASESAITIGAASTFTDLRNHPHIATRIPLLAEAASWTGSIANQNRATLGGNLVNASPAADSSPALLVYDASVVLISTSGSRTLPYRDFHLGYKRTALGPGELLHSVVVPCNHEGYISYIRKVGTRNAQAISKTALAGLAGLDSSGHIADIRLAAASFADRPIRLTATEQAVLHRPITSSTIARARAALLTESRPIDDIRSTAAYRTTVAANLLEEFLNSL